MGIATAMEHILFQVRQRHILLAIRKQCMFRIQWFISQKKWQKRYPNAWGHSGIIPMWQSPVHIYLPMWMGHMVLWMNLWHTAWVWVQQLHFFHITNQRKPDGTNGKSLLMIVKMTGWHMPNLSIIFWIICIMPKNIIRMYIKVLWIIKSFVRHIRH